MKPIASTLLACCLLTSGWFAGTGAALARNSAAPQPGADRIVLRVPDTVRTRTHTFVGTVPPGSRVTVNGEPVHVYKTGSFGYKATLREGDNTFAIESTGPGGTRSQTLRIYCDLTPRPAPQAPAGTTPSIREASLTVRTLPDAYLNYGNGTDRLGGAKINFIDKDILLRVTGENDNLYRVRLSDNRYAFIPKECTEPVTQPSADPSEPCLTGSWSVSNTGTTDRLSISLDARRPYIVREETRPRRLVLDLFGVQSNTNWLTQYPGLAAIRDVQFEQTGSDVLRVIIHLKQASSWGYAVRYEGSRLLVDIRHRPAGFALRNLTIGVDAGHGGTASGAVSAAGYKEKDLTLAMAHTLAGMLRSQGARVVLTRSADTDVSMAERKKILRDNNVDLLISIHCNAGGDPLTTGGTSTYYKHWPNRDLAESILKRLLDIDGVKCFGLVGHFNFSLNAPTEYPSVLVETLFMSNLWDEEHITDPAFQNTMMRQVVKGLRDYLKDCARAEKKIRR